MTPSRLLSLALVLVLGVAPAALAQDGTSGEERATAPGDPAADAAKDPAAKEEKPPEEGGGYSGYKDSEGRDEAYWTSTMGEARGKVLSLQKEMDRLDFEESALQNEFYAKDDPYQREKTKGAWDAILDRRATMQAELEAAQTKVEDLDTEARRTGALPGWLRETAAEEQAREEFEQRTAQTDGPTHQVDLDKLEEDNKKADETLFGKNEDGSVNTSSPEGAAAAAAERAEAEEAATDDEEDDDAKEVAEAVDEASGAGESEDASADGADADEATKEEDDSSSDDDSESADEDGEDSSSDSE